MSLSKCMIIVVKTLKIIMLTNSSKKAPHIKMGAFLPK